MEIWRGDLSGVRACQTLSESMSAGLTRMEGPLGCDEIHNCWRVPQNGHHVQASSLQRCLPCVQLDIGTEVSGLLIGSAQGHELALTPSRHEQCLPVSLSEDWRLKIHIADSLIGSCLLRLQSPLAWHVPIRPAVRLAEPPSSVTGIRNPALWSAWAYSLICQDVHGERCRD